VSPILLVSLMFFSPLHLSPCLFVVAPLCNAEISPAATLLAFSSIVYLLLLLSIADPLLLSSPHNLSSLRCSFALLFSSFLPPSVPSPLLIASTTRKICVAV